MSVLSEPTTERASFLRNLAEAAMSCTHHDCDPSIDIEGVHEIEEMERRFSKLLRSYEARKASRRRRADGAPSETGE